MDTDNGASRLLETLQELAGCTFLSDLHTQTSRQALFTVLSGMDVDAYSAQAWSYAVSYITMDSCTFTDADAARARLIAHLSE